MNKSITWRFLTLLLVFLVFGVTGASAAKGEPQLAYYATHAEPILDWDPSVEFGNGIIVLSNVYETLLRYLPDQDRLMPLLATEYTKSEDGLIWTFKIRRESTEIGKISKKWSGFFKEGLTDADNFGVEFPVETGLADKALLMGAVFLIDFVHFENVNK